MNKNIVYQSPEILEFYKRQRQSWDDFYPSERWVFSRVAGQNLLMGDVLDVGCAGGGLAQALVEKFEIQSYTGIDIHEGVILWAEANQLFPFPAEFVSGDILNNDLVQGGFDNVFSLSCADWNIETEKIIQSCWKYVRPGGYLVISLRVVPGEGVNDPVKSYQDINFSGKDAHPERANYVVFNFKTVLEMFRRLDPAPDLIGAYGYWGSPSATAKTPFEKLVFAVFYIRKSDAPVHNISEEFSLPEDLMI